MAKASRRRQLTGCIRRGAKSKHSSYSRANHLSTAAVDYRETLQTVIALHETAALSSLRSLPSMMIMWLLFLCTTIGVAQTSGDVLPILPDACNAFNLLLQIQGIRFHFHRCHLNNLLHVDYIYHDIPPDVDPQQLRMPVPQNIRFSSWSDQECYGNTSFTKEQLRRMYNCFGLEDLAAEYGGTIPVCNGYRFYSFHPEELYLFMMMKYKTGWSNKHMCDFVFGGNACRWSYGWPWLLKYLDQRYKHIVGNEGLIRYVDQFPEFYEAIQQRVRQVSTHHFHDGTAVDITGLHFLPFSIFGFIDCSIYRINRPHSGPDGNYIGAPRKRRYYDSQRAVFTRFIKGCGVKMQTVMLPNGISFVFGPMSARANDVGGVLHMSALDQWIVAIQQGRPHIYSAFGDKAYNVNALHCIRSYFQVFGPGAHLTPYEELCNDRMKECRESIEWSCGELTSIFQLSALPSSYRLGKRHPYAHQQLRVCHLLVNMYHCFNGDKASRMFHCPPPVLEEYLRLN